MKKIRIVLSMLLVLATSFAMAKTVLATGPEMTQEYRVKNINNLDVRSQIDVYLTQGDKEEIIIETYKSLIPYVKVEQQGERLSIYLDRKVNKIQWNGKKPKLNVHVTIKYLNKISLSGACDLYMQTPLVTDDLKIYASGASDLSLDKIKGKNIKIVTSGASDIDNGDFEAKKVYINASGASDGELTIVADILDMIASGASDFDINVNVDDLTIRAHGSSDFTAEGSTSTFVVDLSGSSDMQAYSLTSDTVTVDASGSSSCRVNALKVIKANGSGASTIYYTGRPENVRVDVSGVSTIRSK